MHHSEFVHSFEFMSELTISMSLIAEISRTRVFSYSFRHLVDSSYYRIIDDYLIDVFSMDFFIMIFPLVLQYRLID